MQRASEAVELLQDSKSIFLEGPAENLEISQHAAFSVLQKAFVQLGCYEKAIASLKEGIKVLRKLPDKSEMVGLR